MYIQNLPSMVVPHVLDPQEGERVLVIDDLVATGGTLSSAIELVRMAGGVVVEAVSNQ